MVISADGGNVDVSLDVVELALVIAGNESVTVDVESETVVTMASATVVV